MYRSRYDRLAVSRLSIYLLVGKLSYLSMKTVMGMLTGYNYGGR